MTALSIMTKHINTSTLRLANLEVLVNAVLYNPSAALHIMETAGSARDFFDKWFTELNHALEDRFPRVHDKKLVLVTLSALIEMQPSTVPDTVKPGWPGIVSGMLKVFKKLPEAIKSEYICLFPLSALLIRYHLVGRDALAESYEDEDEDDELAAELELRDDDGVYFHTFWTCESYIFLKRTFGTKNPLTLRCWLTRFVCEVAFFVCASLILRTECSIEV